MEIYFHTMVKFLRVFLILVGITIVCQDIIRTVLRRRRGENVSIREILPIMAGAVLIGGGIFMMGIDTSKGYDITFPALLIFGFMPLLIIFVLADGIHRR